jgi:hypothetical protein
MEGLIREEKWRFLSNRIISRLSPELSVNLREITG